MSSFRQEFIRFALECGALTFGTFVLKSGRESPYFFNTGLFDTGERLARLARFYANAIESSDVAFDMLYGPAYKGIPLVAAVAVALAEHHGRDVGWCFNRKEAKDHGEGGTTVGAPLAGRVLIVDDVVSAGTSVRESLDVIRGGGARAAGVAISLDRLERGTGELSAVQEIRRAHALQVVSIATLEDLEEYLAGAGDTELLERTRAYRNKYGVTP